MKTCKIKTNFSGKSFTVARKQFFETKYPNSPNSFETHIFVSIAFIFGQNEIDIYIKRE